MVFSRSHRTRRSDDACLFLGQYLERATHCGNLVDRHYDRAVPVGVD